MESLVVQATHIDYGRIHLQTIFEEEEHSTSPAVDKEQAIRTTKVRTLFLLVHLTFTYLRHSQQYVLILLRSLRRKLFSTKGTAPVQLTTN